jgi:ABC-type transport system substrate-binding protein
MFELLAKTVVVPLALLALLVAPGAAISAPPPPNVLQFDLTTDIDYVDPALAFFVPTWQIEYSTCSRLVNFPDAPAPEGSVLQPEIAAGLPIVSPDGLTYTFTLRTDYFFAPSNEQVTAAHFKHAIDRLQSPMMNSPAQRFMTDFAEVVVVNDNTLTIRLDQPSGDLLSRLTMPFFCPLPTSVQIDPDGIDAPVPSAGPYYIESWTRTQEIVVRENPYYGGGRPHRFDEIHYTIGFPLETIRQRIETGEADLGDLPLAAHAELGQRYGPGSPAAVRERQQYFFYPSPTVLYLAMNHDRPLFGSGGSLGDVNLKKAVNFVIDRELLMAQRGAYAGTTTDQHLPIGMPGFGDVEIYPSRPDVIRARELAGWSPGDPGRNGVLYCANRAPAPQQCQIIQANLRNIGLEMEIKLFPRAVQFELTGRRGEPFDMTLEGWHEDYHDPFNFLFLLDGTRLGPPGSTGNQNFAYFNDPAYNAAIQAANQLHGDARANAFGELDVDIAQNAAPWAPYGIPNDRHFFSARVGCQAYVPAFGISLGALCLRPFSVGDATVVEGEAGAHAAVFTVTLAEGAPVDFPFTVDYATADGTADPSDYQTTSGTVTFDAGETTKTISVDVVGDTAQEGDETFLVRVSGHSNDGTIARSAGVGTIQNDDAAPPPPPPPPAPDTQAPTDPNLRSTSHRLGVASVDRTVDVTFEGAVDNQSGVDGFSFAWDRLQATLPDTVKDAEETAGRTTSPALANGRWWFHLRTRDNAGNWTSTRHLGPFVIVPRPRCVVPNVRGKTLQQARRMLAARRCALGRVTRAYSAKVKSGRIIRQNRRPGARLPRGTRVKVTVSRGKRR